MMDFQITIRINEQTGRIITCKARKLPGMGASCRACSPSQSGCGPYACHPRHCCAMACRCWSCRRPYTGGMGICPSAARGQGGGGGSYGRGYGGGGHMAVAMM